MKRKRTRTSKGNSIFTSWGQALLRRGLALLLIACVAVPVWLFAAPAPANAAAAPALTAYDIAPRTAYAGSTLTFFYTINNPDPAPQIVQLGATIGGPAGGAVEWFSDPANEIAVSVAPGTATYTRAFRVPDAALAGSYTVMWGLWNGDIYNPINYASEYRAGYLNIVVAPTVSLTFDDGYTEIYQNALPILNSFGFQATAFAVTGVSQLFGYPVMSLAQLQSLKAAGWDIGSHSVTHPDLTSLTQAQLQAEIVGSKDWLTSNGLGPVWAFAYPYGNANGNVYDMTAANYKYGRTVIEGINSYGSNIALRCVALKGNAEYSTLGLVEDTITQAINENKWAIVLLHGVVSNESDPRASYWAPEGWTTTSVLTALTQFLKDSGVPVKTFAQMEGGTIPANRAPLAVNDSYNATRNTLLTVAAPGVLANDTDADGDALTAAIVSGASHGTVTLASNGSFTYMPATNYTGSDSFTYRANDTKANSNTATVSITVSATNHAPVAVNDAYSMNEDAVLSVTAPGVLINDTDADGDPLTAALVAGASHGTAVVSSNGSFVYTPAANYNGSDSFTYRANDGQANSNTATVTITIAAVNDAPVANADAYSIVRDSVLTVAVPGVLGNDSDVDGNPLTATRLTNPTHGSLTFNSNGSFTYTPTAGYTGADSFTYRANDGTANSNTATVSITVTPPGGATATFGLDSGPNEWYEGGGTINAQRFQNTAGTGTLTKLEVYLNRIVQGGIVRIAVYADNGGAPGTLLLDAGDTAAVVTGWNSISGLNLPVTGNAYYWLLFNMSDSNIIREGSAGPANSHIWINRSYGTFPSTLPSYDGINQWPYVIRATVTH